MPLLRHSDLENTPLFFRVKEWSAKHNAKKGNTNEEVSCVNVRRVVRWSTIW